MFKIKENNESMFNNVRDMCENYNNVLFICGYVHINNIRTEVDNNKISLQLHDLTL